MTPREHFDEAAGIAAGSHLPGDLSTTDAILFGILHVLLALAATDPAVAMGDRE